MRLNPKQKTIICGVVQKYDANAEVYLYGSRVRDDLRGGDIDLMILSHKIDLSLRLSILADLKIGLGEQKIDLKVLPPGQEKTDAFAQQVLPNAVKLNES